MKQFVIIITLVLISVSSNAQDIITMNKGNRINAIVREITSTVVRYNLYNEPNGKVLFVYKDMISSILYQSGKIETFAVTDTPETTQNQSQYQSEPQQPVLQNQERQPERVLENNRNILKLNNDMVAIHNENEIEYEKRKFYMGATQLTERELKLLYRSTPALSIYNQSYQMKKRGTWCIVGGSVLFAIGFSYYVTDLGANLESETYSPLNPTSTSDRIHNYFDTAMVLGAGTAIIGGYYFYQKAGSLKKKSTLEYNQFKSKSNNDYSMNFGLVGNGIGFSISFN